jgi:hypothetical protein
VTTGTLEEMHCTRPVYNPDLAPDDFQQFGPLKEVIGGRKFGANDEV